MFHIRLSFLGALFLPFTLMGCLSNSYYVRHDELVRLSTIPPEERWQSIRAVQAINGHDYPPSDDWIADPYTNRPSGVYVGTVVVDSHQRNWCPPPRGPRPERAVVVGGIGSTSGGVPNRTTTSSAGSKKGNGDPAAAVAIAAAVVVGATAGFTMAASEGARYDGWLAVHEDEPLHLRFPDGTTTPIRLSSLTPAQAYGAEEAIVYEGENGRFPRLGRAPLDRAGFTLTTALHFGGMPQFDRPVATGAGGYLHLGGNIGGIVTLGLAATADTGLDTHDSTLLATLGPEVDVYPLPFAGLYAGAGRAFRNTSLEFGTRADEAWMMRAGVAGEITLTTRLALQTRLGAARYFFASRSPLTWEAQIGLAVY